MRRSFLGALSVGILIGLASPSPGQTHGMLAAHPRIAESLRLLDEWFRAEQAYERIPGFSVAIATDQGVLWANGYGHSDVERAIPAERSTLYSGCSIAKLFTAMAVLQLRDEGRLELHDPVETHLPWFRLDSPPDDAPITIEHLLTHSSGIVRDLPASYWTGPDYPFPTREAVVGSAGREWVRSGPGSHYEYSNVGMAVAGEIVATISGMAYEDYVREHIFEPLGMTRTSSSPGDPGRQPALAQGYTLLRREGTRQRVPPYQVQGLAAVAGLVSTVEDLARFASWQLRSLNGSDEGVLRPGTLRSMHQVQFMPADSWTTAGYGYQLWRENDRTFVGHAGTCPGFQSQLLLRPQDNVAAIVMINAQGVSPNRYAQRSYDIMAPALRAARAGPPEPQEEAATAALERFAGLYHRPFGSEILVLPWQGRLAVIGLPTPNPLSSMETFEPIGEGRFRRSGARADVAEVLVITPHGDELRLWRGHQYWVLSR